MLLTTNNFMSFTSTSLERPGSPVLKDLARATKKVKNKSIDDRVSGDVVMENGLPKVSWWDKLVGNVEGRRLKEEAVLEQELEIGEDDYMINTEGEYLEITFSERIHEWIDKRMAKTIVVRLLGKNIRYKVLCGCYRHNKEICLKLQNKWKQVDSTKQTMVQASESAANTIVGVENAPGLL
ncbi:hypothetical protein Golax_002051 [Gossypium laxum]|uniref:Uncharacterized protein n=1 Tax=Gossypium laxum TaxID=34288 RepID=A0A7J9AQ23_9ROSI|nr:hypothetical protein [Gossypium laxum]